jgi:thiosulfate/3-mercaptopyruvate sulfurtransferase
VAGRVVVDVRAPERFRGEVEPLDPVAGHVPGAVNVHYETMPPAPDWLAATPGPIVAYCGSGVSACVALLALAEAGRDDALLYPGSWSDWSHRELPVETGGG